MKYPDFFDKVETISLQDDLSNFLGTFQEGKVTFSYLDIVKLAGHSCPTVAGAYLSTKEALKVLYPDSLPKRGNIRVSVKGLEKDEVNGVIAFVIGSITGAAGVGGFKGMNEKFARNNLLKFDEKLEGMLKFERVDTNKSVIVKYDHTVIMPNPKLQALMQKITNGEGDRKVKEEFARLWQEKVFEILINHEKYEGILTITKK